MTRTQNLDALQKLNQAYNCTTDPNAQLDLHRAFYLHQIVEALLSENTDSLLTAADHG